MGRVVNATPRPLYPRERPGTHFIRGRVALRAGLNRSGKSRPPPGFDPRTVQAVASRYTDWATRPILSSNINHLTPNGHYMFRTAQLTSRCCILYIYSTNIYTEYFKHAA